MPERRERTLGRLGQHEFCPELAHNRSELGNLLSISLDGKNHRHRGIRTYSGSASPVPPHVADVAIGDVQVDCGGPHSDVCGSWGRRVSSACRITGLVAAQSSSAAAGSPLPPADITDDLLCLSEIHERTGMVGTHDTPRHDAQVENSSCSYSVCSFVVSFSDRRPARRCAVSTNRPARAGAWSLRSQRAGAEPASPRSAVDP